MLAAHVVCSGGERISTAEFLEVVLACATSCEVSFEKYVPEKSLSSTLNVGYDALGEKRSCRRSPLEQISSLEQVAYY